VLLLLLLLLSMQLRQGRELRSRTINNNNNPEFDEVHKLLIDDVDTQVKGGGCTGSARGTLGCAAALFSKPVAGCVTCVVQTCVCVCV
jgi:hypothetical protein